MAVLDKEDYAKKGNWLSGKSKELSTKPHKPTVATITKYYSKDGKDFNGVVGKQDCISVYIGDNEYNVQLNKTNMSTLLNAFEGDTVDTDDFVGLQIMLYTEPLPQDKDKRVIKLMIDDDAIDNKVAIVPIVSEQIIEPKPTLPTVASIAPNDKWRLKTIEVVKGNIEFILSQGIKFPYQLGETKVPNGVTLCERWDNARLAKYAHFLDQIVEVEGIIPF